MQLIQSRSLADFLRHVVGMRPSGSCTRTIESPSALALARSSGLPVALYSARYVRISFAAEASIASR